MGFGGPLLIKGWLSQNIFVLRVTITGWVYQERGTTCVKLTGFLWGQFDDLKPLFWPFSYFFTFLCFLFLFLYFFYFLLTIIINYKLIINAQMKKIVYIFFILYLIILRLMILLSYSALLRILWAYMFILLFYVLCFCCIL